MKSFQKKFFIVLQSNNLYLCTIYLNKYMNIHTTLSIIIPSYNEEKTIIILLDKIHEVCLIKEIKKEVIIIDDGSNDNTKDAVNTYIENNPEKKIKLIIHDTNKGKGAAVRTGIKNCTGDFIIIQDGDLECDPKDYNILLKTIIENELQVVYGSRFLKKENKHLSKWFYIGGKVLTYTANILYNQNLTDEAACYKMFHADFLRSITLKCDRFEFCPEVTAKVAKCGIKIKEVPVNFYPRTKGEGKKIRFKDGIEALCTLLKYRFIK